MHPRTLLQLAPVLISGALGLALLAGCAAAGGSGNHAASSTTPTTGDPAIDSLLASYAQDMDSLAHPAEADGATGTPVSSRSGVFVERAQPADAANPDPGTPDAIATANPDTASGAAAQPPPATGAANSADATANVQRIARELAVALRTRALTGVTPYEDLSRVAMLEAIAPGVLEGLGETAADDSADLVALLAPSERDALRAARRTARSLAASESADPSMAADALMAAAAHLEESQAIRIRNALLCRRVDGFARYDAFDSTTFLAGRANPVIVYAEVDRFRQEPVSGNQSGATPHPTAATARPGSASGGVVIVGAPPAGSRFAVRLTQSLNLYFSDGGLLVWRRPPQTVTDYSTDRFRDFYIIDTIQLPATLAAGSYSLKVVIRDEATGQQAEQIIPITLVAEAGLAQGGVSVMGARSCDHDEAGGASPRMNAPTRTHSSCAVRGLAPPAWSISADWPPSSARQTQVIFNVGLPVPCLSAASDT